MSLSSSNYRLASFMAFATLGAFAAIAQEPRSENITEPVFRVAHETPAKPVSAKAGVAKPVADKVDFFDLSKRPGEHPLASSKRFAERVRKHIKENVKDYTCLFSKQERIDGKMSEMNYINMRVLHDPFAIHLLFREPKPGQECLYVKGSNNDKMLARGHGWRKRLGVLHLDPTGDRAMDGQRHPITMAGVLNLTEKMIEIANNDMKYGECEVKRYMKAKIGDRPTVMVEIIHPVPRREFKFHVARIYVDRELKMPVRYEAYDWKKDRDGDPLLTEYYDYRDVKVNTGLTASDFTESDSEVFE